MSMSRIGLVLGVILVPLTLAGCGPSAVDPLPTDAGGLPSPSGNLREYEYNVALAECINEKGWDVVVDGVGGWGIVFENVPVDQQDAAIAASDECRATLGNEILEVNDDTINYTYDNNLRVTECLDALGYTTPIPPEREVFIAVVLDNPDDDSWDPYEFVSEESIGDAVIACPQ